MSKEDDQWKRKGMSHLVFIVLLLWITGGNASSTWEKDFLEIPNAAYAYEYLAFYTSIPHTAGTEGDYQTAKYTLDKFREFGLDSSRIEVNNVLLSYPKKRAVTLTYPKKFEATLQEDYIPKDPTTGDPRIVPTFNGYAPSGNVTAELVYLNYGSIQDHEVLESMGIDVKGKIGIARYGGLFRGTKAMIAQMKGMVGLLIYSDPADDGYSNGKVFPEGPWRPKSGVQRGSVGFLSICPGDPSRKACSNNPNYNYTQGIPQIPVQPLSWGDALPLLQNLAGATAPSKFQGGLNFTYHIGPGPAVVNVYLDIEFKTAPIWNVVANISGDGSEAQSVLIGNHRDAWVFGAADPNSGSATLLEIARSFGILVKRGWKPKRNILLASWDGEEYGLLGSTAWVEANAKFSEQELVAYLNLDTAVTGKYFGVGATPSLSSLIREVAAIIKDPDTGKPISQLWSGNVATLGSGSDYTAFLDHYGIPSLDMGFSGNYGVYHSTYDDLYWMTHFGDPTFVYHRACAQFMGLLAMKIADATVLPFDYTIYGTAMDSYLQSTEKLLQTYNHTMDLSQLTNAIKLFQKAASKGQSNNERLALTERQFISKSGLPLRPYYKHVIQAPGLYAGYAASVFPGMQQTIEAEDWKSLDEQYAILYTAITNAANFLMGN